MGRPARPAFHRASRRWAVARLASAPAPASFSSSSLWSWGTRRASSSTSLKGLVGGDQLAGFGAKAADVAEAEAQSACSSQYSMVQSHSEMLTSTGRTRRPWRCASLIRTAGTVEAHGLVVQERAGECGEVVALEICAGIGQQREARGVRFGKAIEREGGDRLHDAVLHLAGDAVLRHAFAQPAFDIEHALLRPFEAHGAAQFLGFAAGEVGGDHRHPQAAAPERAGLRASA